MRIAIELLIILILILLLSIWAVWFKLITWWSRFRYKPDNDKSKYGEDKRRKSRARETETREPSIEDTTLDIPRLSEPTERTLLPTAASDNSIEHERVNGKTSNSNGKPRKVFRNPFRRR